MLFVCSFISIYSQQITITTGEYPPFSGKKLYNQGFDIDVIKRAFAEEGYKAEVNFYPWKRAYSMFKAGNVDATAFWYRSPEREKIAFYSDPINIESTVFFHRKGESFEWEKLEDLNDFKIGVTRGYTYTEKFWELNEKGILDFDVVNDDKTNFKKLLNSRIDIFPSSKVVGYYILRNQMSSSAADLLSFNEKPLLEGSTHVLFLKSKPNSKKLLEIFNSGLKKIKENGTYDKMKDDLHQGKYD